MQSRKNRRNRNIFNEYMWYALHKQKNMAVTCVQNTGAMKFEKTVETKTINEEKKREREGDGAQSR